MSFFISIPLNHVSNIKAALVKKTDEKPLAESVMSKFTDANYC